MLTNNKEKSSFKEERVYGVYVYWSKWQKNKKQLLCEHKQSTEDSITTGFSDTVHRQNSGYPP